MTEIVPRWEWRAFGGGLTQAEARLRRGEPEQVRESDEVYLLSARTGSSVKIRDGTIDVKRLVAVDEDGLQQWRPEMKAAFPISADDARAVFEALAPADPPAVDRDRYTDGGLRELVEAAGDLRAVDVHKRREHYTFNGCMAELAQLTTGRASSLTLAVESEDPALVLAAVRDLGLDSGPNVDVPTGLKRLAGVGARRYAVIDVGTNSVKFLVGERRDGSWSTVVDRSEVTRLGEGLDSSGELGEQPVARTVDAIAAMAEEARASGVEAIAAVGTAGVRMASNRDRLIEAVKERAGVELEVLSGDEEARLAYLGVTAALDVGEGSAVVFDTGGGSSQFTFGHGGEVDERFSVDVGAVRFTERYGLDGRVDEDTLDEARRAIRDELGRLDGHGAADVVIGMGGAVTNLTAVMHELEPYDPNVVQGSVLGAAEIDRQIELYRTRTADERRRIVGLQPKRAEVILAGACIVRAVLAGLGSDSLTVSDRGLRHGLLTGRFGPAAG